MQHTACTTILIGKKASLDGSTIIARSEDLGSELIPQRFAMIKPDQQPQHYQAITSKQKIDETDLTNQQPLRYTCVPAADQSHGIWAAGGINAANVAMTATETIIHFNARIEGIDPCLNPAAGGLGEEDFVTLILPYLHSAKEGVKRAGYLVNKYGTYERSGMAFADQNELWYFETIGGHHWIARRIPDDACVIATNRLNIDEFKFDDPDFACSSDLQELIEQYHLNPDRQGYNMRHIFGSADSLDARYNNPRAWYGHNFFNPNFGGQPEDQDQHFICKANRKISIEDIQQLISSHYEDTIYDPYGHGGTPVTRWALRPIAINQTVETHILQLRPQVSDKLCGLHWLSFGPNLCNCFLPLYAGGEQVPEPCQTSDRFDLTQLYWLEQFAALICDYDYDAFKQLCADYVEQTMAKCRQLLHRTDTAGLKLSENNLTKLLDQTNAKLADLVRDNLLELLHQCLATGHRRMRLRYNLFDLPENHD
ncbi:MAG: C69 family dipeptidase [Lactobacillus sp.]|jgi:dipeptidase|nr:C69 family dipeptidase [Lactobacillus sp.]MCH3905505.1 C69 family dipeptidase [Lactobacillus sp.]MCH3990927.1 C69 family dipeptidase [Lactobacillus sp.]MCH4068357.1 C69 family dipeptidase [Lactobacillus sp.]MCI1304370.1 C69 family dipeptidase [Lactobacillus sp.]